MEISQALVGEAGAAVEASDICQGREVVVQQSSSTCVYVQHTVTETSGVGLKDGDMTGWQNIWHTIQNVAVEYNITTTTTTLN